MVETLFLALIATAVSILPSAALSFFAAHNLMRPVRTQLGNLLLSFALLPVGWLIGTLLLSEIGRLVLETSRAEFLKALLALVVVAALLIAISYVLRMLKPQVRALLNGVAVAVLVVLVLGLLSGLALLIGGELKNQAANSALYLYLGTFIGSIGQLLELLLVPLCGIVGAFAVSSLGGGLTKHALKRVTVPTSHILGALLGAIAGALLLGLMASIGMSAAWLGLLTPFAAAALASALLPQVYRRFATPSADGLVRIHPLVRTGLGWAGALVAFAATFLILNVRQAMIEGALPARTVALTFGSVEIYSYILQAMLIGALLGAVSGGLAGTKASFPLGGVLYNVTRTLLNVLRSIEPLIMGLVFVIWVGIGPFAGVLALALHSIASLGKLYSEQIENIDVGPIEALQSTGANRLQTIMYAVVPQIIPPYIAFTMYRWDINVRMSTIIGFVGGGGIGFLLQQQINLLRYRDAGVAVLAIAIVVSILDYASAAIRERYT